MTTLKEDRLEFSSRLNEHDILYNEIIQFLNIIKEGSYQLPRQGRNETRLSPHDIKYLNENINSIMHLCVYGCGFVDTYVVNHHLHGIVYVVYNNYFQKGFCVQKEPFFHNYDNDIDNEVFPYLSESEIPEEIEQIQKKAKLD